MAQRDFGRAYFLCMVIQDSPPQPGTYWASGLTFWRKLFNDGIRILLDNVEGHPDLAQILRQHVFRKTRLLLIQIHRNNVKLNGSVLLKTEHHV